MSFGSSGKEVLYFLASWAASTSETALLTSAKSSLEVKETWPEPVAGVEGSPDILMGEGGKVLAEEMGEGGGEFVGVIKFNTMGVMSEY